MTDKEKRCCAVNTCKKKLKLATEFQCKCSLLFCMSHRYAQEHNCTYDHKKEQREKIEKSNPKIDGKKIQKI